MCRELTREPAWVAAIRLAVTQGEVTAEAVIDEANLRPDVHRTVADVLQTMAERDLLDGAPGPETPDRYVVGPVLREAAPSPDEIDALSDHGLHRWGGQDRQSV